MNYLCRNLIGMFLIFFSGTALSNDLAQQRNDFLLAEKLIDQNNESALTELSAGLKDYPLYPYLQYLWLKDHLQQTDKLTAFLTTYQDSRYAGLLRSKWLHELARNERWLDFLQFYQATDNLALRCQFYWATYKTGKQLQALNEAKNIWLSGDSLPDECEPLMSALVISPMLTTDLLWQRFELALKKDNVYLAEYVQRFLDKPNQAIAAFWLQVHKKPALIAEIGFAANQTPFQGRIFAHGIDRMAKQDPDWAIVLWDAGKKNVLLDKAVVEKLERRLGIALGVKKDKRAYNRLSQLAGVDAELREWKVRSALLEQNWQHVLDALNGLTLEEQQDPRWQYWQARALAETGAASPAVQAMYNKAAKDRSMYGFLAADALNQPYKIINKPLVLLGNQLETLSQETDFRVARELDLLNRRMEAQRQWWYAVKKLSKERRMIAAKLAQQWQWDQVAILTMVKADYWDDLDLRFPLGYLNSVKNNADRQNLDPAIIFGLIRQESMLDNNARSSVGARGLMQIMPKTGKQIASQLKEKWQSEDSLYNPEVNVRYGAYYFKQLLNGFNGNFALATAAYNAGPNRVKTWLPKDQAVSADIWIETIPFKETRKYVSSVVSYAMIYQHLIQSNAMKIKNLFTDIQPG